MEIRIAKSAGFCFGAKKAVDLVYECCGKGKPVYTLGPIIHNEIVVDDLKKHGAFPVGSERELEDKKDAYVVIRSHGVEKQTLDYLESIKDRNGLTIVDATCPFVKKIYRYVEEASAQGRHVLIAGDKDHPEVKGIASRCGGKVTIIEDPDSFDVSGLNRDEKYTIVSQTTYNYKKFKILVEMISELKYDMYVVSTVCNATEVRQEETKELAGSSDAMIVVGGEHSSNSRKLYEIACNECKNTYFIQTLSDLDLHDFKSLRSVGITAGASTPYFIIKEVWQGMSEASFEQMLEDSLKTIHNGEVVEGTVIGVKEDEIVLNIGYKADGIITRNEYTNTPNLDLTTVVKEGDVLSAKVLQVNDGEGQVKLTYKRLAAERGSKRLEEAFNNKEVLKATVVSVLNGGICVVVDETRVFIPASLVSDTFEKNLEKYKDQEIEFVITEFNPKRRRIIGDRKQLLVAKKAEMLKELFERIHVGDTIEGTVKNVTDFGAFIDLGGADGLLHISEMSWGRVENPKKVFKPGDVVKAFIKDIQGEKIALSLKFPDQNPWADAENKFAIGNVVTGKVARMTDFGAFVELVPGVDALLHVSQISREHVEKPSDVLKTGQEITAKIVDFNLEDKKISLSIKALEAPKESEENTETVSEE